MTLRALIGKAPAVVGLRPKASELEQLSRAIGSDDFYARVAAMDPKHADEWQDMVAVQWGFKRAEPSYDDPRARTYSESVRETLHRITVELLRRRRPGQNVYKAFVELHPTLFKENGAYQLPLSEELEILSHTRPSMLFAHGNLRQLGEGLLRQDRWRPLVQEASEQTRDRRKKLGLPVTKSGYRARPAQPLFWPKQVWR